MGIVFSNLGYPDNCPIVGCVDKCTIVEYPDNCPIVGCVDKCTIVGYPDNCPIVGCPEKCPNIFSPGIYHSVLKNKKIGMDKVLLATKVLPFLLPITIEPTLNLAQVYTVCVCVCVCVCLCVFVCV